MSFLFNVPDSLKKTENAAGSSSNSPQSRAFQRPTTNYSDLDVPSGGGAPPAPERRQRLGNVMPDRSKFTLRRAPDGSILPKPTMPARTIGNPLAGAPRPLMPTRATLTHAGLIPAGARNPYTLKRTGAGKPAVPQRHPSPLSHDREGNSATEEGEIPEEEEQGMRGRGSARLALGASRPEQTVKFADLLKQQQRAQIPSLFGGSASLFGSTVDGGGSATDGPKPLFGSRAGRTPSPSGMTRRREASPLHVPPPVAARAAAAVAAAAPPLLQQQESRGDRSSARTLTAHDLTGMRSVTDVARSLRRLAGRACPADFDRYQLLDERDKLLCKLREIKPSFFSKSGSCKDMCPEKERYVRVVQMRVADYELDMLGEMEPRRMVKEYSRSAADQEEPLEHEMRPSAVLEKTMEYLLTDIVDGTIESSADSSSADGPTAPRWYDFLWNRTRAIRKELTQQMILDESAVRLIECCTRMHMYAGHALGRLPREEFDPAMCEENLSKCLQSLRHLYEDLAKKEIFVESEAEFRAYDVMLHLTDSNILRQVLSYRRAVRESPAVRLALKLFSAIQSNNYTRFFRLVREQATYAQCCILYRYFGKMRLHAFSTMATAYKGGTLPMQLIAKVLAFESVEQAIDVAASYGLQYTQDAAGAPGLLPDMKDFNATAGEAAGAVTAGWIEQKREGRKLSEIFRGGPARLPSSSSLNADGSLSAPVDSFDPSTAAYSHDPVLNEYLRRLGSAAPDEPIAPSSVVTRAQQKRAEVVVERPAAALAAAAAASSKPAFGGLSSFGKLPSASTAAASEGGATTGGFSSVGKSVGGGSSSFGSGSSAFGSGLSSFGAKPVVPGFSFASSTTTNSEATTVDEKKPLFGLIKQETNTVPKFARKREVSETQIEQTAERLYKGVVDEASRDIAQKTLTEVQAERKKEEQEQREKERIRKEQQERAAKEALERAAAAAAAAKSAEKRRRSEQARLAACSDHLFKRTLWPALVKEVIDVATRVIVQEAVREEEQRIADGVARYKQRMHALWLRQFTDRWKAYARWRKEERARVRQVLAAIVSRNPFDGIGAASLKRRISSPDPDDWRAKKARGGRRDPLTTLAVLRFIERRQARIVLCVVAHWREWAERRARRRDEHKWPLNRACAVPRVRPPTPMDDELHQQQQDENDYGGHNTTGLPLMEERRATAKKHKSRRSVGLYPFLAHDDSFLDGRATPIRGATPMREEEAAEGQRRRKLRVSGIFNSTAVAETTAVPAIGFQTFVGQQQESAVSDADVEYAAALMEQTQWTAGEGARERWRRKKQRREGGEEEWRRMEEWQSRPLEPLANAVPSWRGLFDVLNAEPEGGRGHSLRALETPEPLLDGTMMMRVEEQTMRAAPVETHWQREEREQRDRIAARNAAIDAQLAESKRLRKEAAADRARQDALLAQLEC